MVSKDSEEYNKWQHDLTVAYIYADTLDYFSSNFDNYNYD